MTIVWAVTRWEFGGGGDDDRQIVGVFSTPERAYAAAGPSDEVQGYELDVVVPAFAETDA